MKIKKLLLAVTAIIAFAMTVTAQTIPSYIPTNGLVGYWPFNGNANDESGNGNHGIVNGATLTTDRNGVAGKAYSFNGLSNWIDAINAGPTGTGITLSYWFKSNQTSLGGIFCYGGNNWGTQFEILHNYWSAQTTGPCHGPALHNSGSLVSFNSNQFLNNNFHHVVMILPQNASSVNSLYTYIDGSLINNYCSFANYGAPAPNIGSDYPIRIGKNINYGNGTVYFNGTLDDIAIYNRALTQTEITQLYTNCIATTSTTNLTIPSTSLPYTWNGLTFNASGSKTKHLTNAAGCDSGATLNLTVINSGLGQSACTNDTIVSIANAQTSDGFRTIVYGSDIYAFGSQVSKYSTVSNSWSSLLNMPTVRGECGVAEVNGIIYCLGGWTGSTSNKNEAYNISTNTWSTMANLPSSITGCIAVSLNNKVYIVGGTLGTTTTYFYEYNPATNTYLTLATPSQNRMHAGLVTYNSKIYLIGGHYYNGSYNSSNKLDEYDPTLNTWSSKANIPVNIQRTNGTIYDNKLYLFGGTTATPTITPLNSFYAYDFVSNSWTTMKNMPLSRASFDPKTINGVTYLFGGHINSNITTSLCYKYYCIPCVATSSTSNLTIPSTSLPYTWNGLTFNAAGSQTKTLTNVGGCDSTATLNLTVINTALPSYLPANGLVGWWPFNGNANDESGNGNNGTVNGATLTSDRNGNSGKAYSFACNSIKANVNTTSITSQLTISFWYYRNSQGCFGPRVLEFSSGSNLPGQLMIEENFPSGLRIAHITSAGLNNFLGWMQFNTLTNQTWSNYVYTNNGTAAKIYQNGILINQYNSPGLPLLDGDVAFGWMNHPANDGINGKLDDIAIYNRALTQAEISALYQNTIKLNLTTFLEGSYADSSSMTATANKINAAIPSSIADSITVELHASTSPYDTMYSSKGVVNTNGTAAISFPNSTLDSSYYIVIKHRNSIETWSASPVTISNHTIYNFTTAASQAYGANLSNLGKGVFGMYSGDINQDGSVDFNDYPELDIASNLGVLGYDVNDLNGDASVDFNDFPILDINSNNGIIVMRP
jgi:hypothetical protein